MHAFPNVGSKRHRTKSGRHCIKPGQLLSAPHEAWLEISHDIFFRAAVWPRQFHSGPAKSPMRPVDLNLHLCYASLWLTQDSAPLIPPQSVRQTDHHWLACFSDRVTLTVMNRLDQRVNKRQSQRHNPCVRMLTADRSRAASGTRCLGSPYWAEKHVLEFVIFFGSVYL